MEKILFVHDGYIYRDDEGDYYGLHINNDLVERYKNFGPYVTFLMRVMSIAADEVYRYIKFTDQNFSCIEIPNFKSATKYLLYKREATMIIYSAVENADMVIVRMPSMAGAIAIKQARKLGKPYLVEMVACTYDAYWHYGWKGKLIAHYKYHRTQKIMRDCPHVIYVTKHFLQERYPNVGTQVGISDVALRAQPTTVLDERIDRIRNRAASAPLVLGTVAAVDVPYKGQKDVIKAVAELKRRGLNVQYRLVGQGNPRRLASLIHKLGLENEVTILGPMRHDEVFDFLKTLDVYIQPSRLEGLPRAVLEAMSVALPVLGSRVGGIPELLGDACMFSPGDVRRIADMVAALTSEAMVDQAARNYNAALDYRPDVLDRRRTAFYQQWLEHNTHA